MTLPATTTAPQARHHASDWRNLIEHALAVLWPSLPDGVLWIEAQVHVESGGDPAAQSHCGAQGLLQLMPKTAGELGVSNPFDPAENLRGGITYLHQQHERLEEIPQPLDRLRWAFACYNCGAGYVRVTLDMARRAAPSDWWRWEVGRRWLSEADFHARRPDAEQVWAYVSRIEQYVRRVKLP